MTRVVEDRELREDLRRRGAMRAKAFSWEKSARDLLRVYEALIPAEAA
jgi:glycosyltransferase involved in cell wall biosynthesis